MYSYVRMLTSLYQFDKKLTRNFLTNTYFFKARIVTLKWGVKDVENVECGKNVDVFLFPLLTSMCYKIIA